MDVDGFSLADHIEMETVSGDISLKGQLSPNGNYELDSHSGTIKMTIPKDADFALTTQTFSGDMDCSFDLLISGKIDPKKLQGLVGDGGANLTISTFSGDIRINKY